MNTKNLDAINRMVTRLQSIRETEFLYIPTFIEIGKAIDILKGVAKEYDPKQSNSEEIRTE